MSKDIEKQSEDIGKFLDSLDIFWDSVLMYGDAEGSSTLEEDVFSLDSERVLDINDDCIPDKTTHTVDNVVNIENTIVESYQQQVEEVNDEAFVEETSNSYEEKYFRTIQSSQSTTYNRDSEAKPNRNALYKQIGMVVSAVFFVLIIILPNLFSEMKAIDDSESKYIQVEEITEIQIDNDKYYKFDKNNLIDLELSMEVSFRTYSMFSVTVDSDIYILLLSDNEVEDYYDDNNTFAYKKKQDINIDKKEILQELNQLYGYSFTYENTYFIDQEYKSSK